jgi:cyclopropane fatty-acyl-phospholipid synthase-like methyltransferase
MPHYQNVQEVEAAFEFLIGKYDLVYYAHLGDITALTTIANYKEGESVLDLGTGSAGCIVEAKQRVGSGLCVGVDCVQGLLQHDATRKIQAAGFSTAPSAPAATSIRLFHHDVASADFPQALRSVLPSGHGGFNVITGLKIFDLLPNNAQIPALERWREMLAPGGRLVLHLSLVVKGTECPATMAQAEYSSSVTLQDGSTYPKWRADKQVKVAPPGMWLACRAQVQQLATQCHLQVVSMTDTAAGDDHLCDDYEDQSGALLEFYRHQTGTGPYKADHHVTWLQDRVKAMKVVANDEFGMYFDWKNVAVIAVLMRD